MISQRPVRIAVCGAGTPDDELDRMAEQVGMALGRAKAVLLCGGLFGVMEAAARGAAAMGAMTVGFLPGVNPDDANDHIMLPIATGLGEARNAVLVRSADAVIALGGDWGTMSEIALAKKINRPVILLKPSIALGLQLPTASSPEEAVAMALAAVQR